MNNREKFNFKEVFVATSPTISGPSLDSVQRCFHVLANKNVKHLDPGKVILIYMVLHAPLVFTSLSPQALWQYS